MSSYSPATRFELIDQTKIPTTPTTPANAPLFLAACTTDKGDEKLGLLDVTKWQKSYGDISFAKHGQAQLQVDRILNNNGRVLFKRLTASDAKLANIVIVAKVRTNVVQKTDADNKLLYYVVTGGETTSETTTVAAGNVPAYENRAVISFEAKTMVDLTSMTAGGTQMAALYKNTAIAEVQKKNSENALLYIDNTTGLETTAATTNENPNDPIMIPDPTKFKEFPLFAIYDNGKGISNKKIRISPDYSGSKSLDYFRYQLEIIDGNTTKETTYFVLDADKIINKENLSIKTVVNKQSVQVKADCSSLYINAFVEEVEAISGLTGLMNNDILFGKTKKAVAYTGIETEGTVNISSIYGIALASGSDGIFGANDPSSETYQTELTKQLTDFYSGVSTEEIYDLDKYKLDAIIDSNLPAAVKRKIESLGIFREDCVFFEDLGIVSSASAIKTAAASAADSKFVYLNHLSYDVIDDYSGKQITVTVGYTLAKLLPNHFMNGRNKPLSGEINGAVIEDAVDGTVNYTPIVTPTLNQKDELDDINVNYAVYRDSLLELQTQYTNQSTRTDFSFLNNILATQQVVKAVRTYCPKSRYTFLDGDDFNKYKKAVEEVISQYASNFKSLSFEYVQDDTMVANKVFYAAIKASYRDYIQSEYFKIYAID